MKAIIIILLTTLLSCTLLKKDKAVLKELNQKETAQLTEQRNTSSKKQELAITDSSLSNLIALIWPTGKFTFSAEKGFEGEAEKVVVKQRQQNQKNIHIKNEEKKDSSLFNARYEKKMDTLTMVKKIKVKHKFSWYWLLLLPVAYIIYRVYIIYKK